MKTEQTRPNQQESRREAARFLWHMLPPWKDSFTHDHWWVGQPAKATSEAALWEAMRRHPDVEQVLKHPYSPALPLLMRADSMLCRDGSRTEPRMLTDFIGHFARKPWPTLRKGEQRMFVSRLWAASPRYHVFCTPPGILLTEDMMVDLGDLWRQQLIPMAIDMRASPQAAADWVKQVIKEKRERLKPLDGGRAHVSEWLQVIREFEKEEQSRDQGATKRDDQLFARYRRCIHDLWPSAYAKPLS